MTTASESAGRQIQTTEIAYLKFLKHTSILHHFKDMLLIPPQCSISKRLYDESTPSDYVRSVPSHRKTQPFFQPKRGVTKSRNRDKNESLTFDDLHQMTLIELHVTQYMYVLFDKVHIYI